MASVELAAPGERLEAEAAGAPRAQRLLEGLGIAAAGLLATALAWRLAQAPAGPGDAAWLLAGALLAYPAADLVSGLVHWWADRVGDERTPFLGPRFVAPFRAHHDEPLALLEHGFVETNGNNCLAVAAGLALFWLSAPPAQTPGALFAHAFALSLALWSAFTNQIHQWAHAPRVVEPVRWLQQAGLILGREHHARHHRAPYDCCYCITAGWLDPLVDRLVRRSAR